MDKQQVEKLVEHYHTKINLLDSHKDTLNDRQREKYERMKERFIARIQSWQKITDTDSTQLKSNLDEGINELESIWFSAHHQ